MRYLLVFILLTACDDPCAHLDPDIRVFWSAADKAMCPASKRQQSPTVKLIDLGLDASLAEPAQPK